MPAITISKRNVDQAKPRERDTFLWDRQLSGFGLKVTPAGSKVYLCQYRTGGRGSPTKRVTIGRHGAPWTPDQARKKARAILGGVAKGEDPAAEKRAKREAAKKSDGLFESRAREFLKHGRKKRGLPMRPATKNEYKRALLTYATPLHGKPLDEIRRGQIASLIRNVASERGEVSAMRCRAALSRLYSWAIANGHAEINPVTGTEGYETPKRKRVLNDEELRAIWAATTERLDFDMIVRLALWAGTRRSEPGGMRDSEHGHVKTKGFDGDVWTVPGERTKNHRDLALPLPRQARAALASWPRVEGRDLLFGQGARRRSKRKLDEKEHPERGSNGFQGWSDAKERLDARMLEHMQRLAQEQGQDPEKVKLAPWTLHDLRRTVETRLAGLGVPKEISNRILNHAAGPITEAYDRHNYLPEKAAALQRWADELDRILGEQREPNNVVAMTGRR